MRRLFAPTLAAAAALMILAGCGGSGGGDAHTTSGDTAASSPSASPSPTAGSTPSATAQAATACTTSELKAAIVDRSAAAGSTYFTVRLTNVGQQPCTLRGYGGLSLTDASGHQLGAPATRDTSAGAPQLVTLAPGKAAGSRVQLAEATNYDESKCGFKPAVGLRIYPPDETHSIVVQFFGDGCTVTTLNLLSSQPYAAAG